MPKHCVIRQCRLARDYKSRRFFGFPQDATSFHAQRLNMERRKRWIQALRLNPNVRWSHLYVCSSHFVAGRPAKNTDVKNVDWVPSLNLLGLEAESLPASESDSEIPPSTGISDSFSLAQPSDPDDTSQDAQEQLVGEEVDLRKVLSTELEIKEEEVELDGLSADDVQDPIGDDAEIVWNGSDTGVSTASADEAVRRDATAFRKRKIRKEFRSSTESADESLEKVPKKTVKPGTGVKRKKKKYRKITKNGWIVPRFVPGMMIQRKNQFLCLECGQQFDSIVLFATHTTRFHLAQLNRYPHSCVYCPRKFRKRLTLQRHLLHHSRLEAVHCPICRDAYYSACGLVNHLANHQVVPKKPEVTSISKIPIYSKTVTPLDNVCFACGTAESTEDDLTNHVNLHQGHLQCRACYEMFATASEFLDHVQTVHNNQAELTYYTCPRPYCPISFLSAADMQKHSQNCTPPRQLPEKRPFSGVPLTCEICNLTYYEVDHFATHLKLHSVLAQEIPGQKACQLCAFVANNCREYGLHMVHSHGFRDRMDSLVGAYEKLNIVAPARENLGSDESSDGGSSKW